MSNVKILHTSDWHLGRTLHGFDLHDHQEFFLDHLAETVKERKVDALLVSGDIYDRAYPAVETVRLLSRALTRLSALTTVIVTPGNHDSATRLGFGSDLMHDSVRILASLEDFDSPVILAGDEFDVAVYGLPYLDPDLARTPLRDKEGEFPPRSHEGVLTAAMNRVRSDLARRTGGSRPVRSVVMAHAFVVGGTKSPESERDISVGGVDSAPSEVFDGVDYVALGHLHGPQKITVPNSTTLMRYSGSPLAFSIKEKDHKKSTVLLEIGPEGTPGFELILAPVPRPLKELTGTMAELLHADNARWVDAWVMLKVTDATYPESMQSRLRERFAHVLGANYVGAAAFARGSAPVVTESMSALEVATQFVGFVTEAAPTEEESLVLRNAYDAVKAKGLTA
ncbi:MAG: exonuclease SbcCD subunit D [Aeromicrobium sp.]